MKSFPRREATLLTALVVALLASLMPAVALAAGEPVATTITLSVPDSVPLGQTVKVRARLSDASGNPIPNANISFTNPGTFFLGTTGDAVIDQVRTDKDGVAEVEHTVRSAGQLGFKAEFQGNDRYNASRASAPIRIDGGSAQQYRQEAGVNVPGLNAPPFVADRHLGATGMAESAASKTGLASLWPAISFWPIGLALLIVWSLYAAAVWQTWQIVRARSEPSIGGPIALNDAAPAGSAIGRLSPGEYYMSSHGGGR